MAKFGFESTESLVVAFEPFIDKTTGDPVESGDTVTVGFTRPDTTTGSLSATQDSTTKIWVLTIASGSFQSGNWLFRATSSNANTRPQYRILTWGTGSVEDVLTIKTRLGSPVGVTISADIAQVETNAVAIKAKTDNLPVSPASTSDVSAATTAANAAATSASTAATQATTAATISAVVQKLMKNRWKFDDATAKLTIYDDDKVTPLFVFDNKDAGGLPTTTAVRERTPV